jgi:hypothetical protein
LTVEIVGELEGEAHAESAEEARAGVRVKATLIAILVLQVAWSTALLLLLTSVIR